MTTNMHKTKQESDYSSLYLPIERVKYLSCKFAIRVKNIIIMLEYHF